MQAQGIPLVFAVGVKRCGFDMPWEHILSEISISDFIKWDKCNRPQVRAAGRG